MTIRKVERAAPSLTKMLDDDLEAAQNQVHVAAARKGIYRYIESLFDGRSLSFVSKYNPKTGRITFRATVPTSVFDNICRLIGKQVMLDNPVGPKAQIGQVSPSVQAVFQKVGLYTIDVSDFKLAR